MLHLRGWYYPATVKNISLGGALVGSGTSLTGLHFGEPCNFFVYEDFFCEFYCKVVRVNEYAVALKIIDGYSESPFVKFIAGLNDALKGKKRRDNVGRIIEIYPDGPSRSLPPSC